MDDLRAGAQYAAMRTDREGGLTMTMHVVILHPSAQNLREP